MRVRPITPKEALKARAVPIEHVLEVFNELIAQRAEATTFFTIDEREVLDLLQPKFPTDLRDTISTWLDIEPTYKAAGWRVDYSKGIGAASPFWTFRPKGDGK